MKKCNRCLEIKPFDDFSRDKNKKDGFSTLCKKCRSESFAKYRQKNRDILLIKNREYSKNNAEKLAEYQRQYRKNNPEKVKAINKKSRDKDLRKLRARQRVRMRVYRGTMQKLPCQVCGDPKSQAHHQDYNKPLEVIWLCQKHHQMLHRD